MFNKNKDLQLLFIFELYSTVTSKAFIFYIVYIHAVVTACYLTYSATNLTHVVLVER